MNPFLWPSQTSKADSRIGWPHFGKAAFQSPKCQTVLRIEHSITCFILTSCHVKNLIYVSPTVPATALPESVICPFCFQWRQLGNHHVRLRPKRNPTARIRKLLKRDSAGKRLSAEQTVVLRKFKRASNALVRSSPHVLCPLEFSIFPVTISTFLPFPECFKNRCLRLDY